MTQNRTGEELNRWNRAVADLLSDGRDAYSDEQSDLLDEAALRAVRNICPDADQKMTQEILEATKSSWEAMYGRTSVLRGQDSFPVVLRDYYGIAERIALEKRR